jgi:hypothetical protein
MNKYRHEIKISINPFDKEVLSSRLSHVLQRDRHTDEKGYYRVRSLYFDDMDDRAVQEKLLGVKYREKFRLRTYNNSSSVIRLEKKVKNNTMGYKESAMLTQEECQDLIAGDYHFLRQKQEAICRQLYIKMRTALFKPKTIIEYKREAYVWEPGRIRITIDSDVRTGISSTDFWNFAIPMVNVVENNTAILEIKYDNYLPSHISNLLRLDSRQRAAISKYVLGRRFG